MKRIFLILITLLFGIGSVYSADRTISGKISDSNGEPIIGVTVSVQGTTVGTISKAGGLYHLTIPGNAKVVVFRYVGLKTVEMEIGDKSELNITMAEDVVMTDQVVVTAIGMEREKKSLGYSIEEVSGKTLSDAKTTDVIDALAGQVAGLRVNSSSGTPGSSSFITIRGITSVTGNNQPLFVVDGVPIVSTMDIAGNPDNGVNNLLTGVQLSDRAVDLNPDDIESMTVLKGPAASSLYGIRAAGGALIITTKKGNLGPMGKIKVSYSASLEYDQVNKLPELQNKYALGANGVTSQVGTFAKPPYSWGGLLDTLRYSNVASNFNKNGTIVGVSDPTATSNKVTPYDNLNNFFQVGKAVNHSLNLSGANEFGSFYLSMANLSDDGVVPNSTFDRTSLRFNGDANISTRLKASASASYVKSGGNRIQQGNSASSVMADLLRTPVTFDNSWGYGKDAVNHQDAFMFTDGTQRTYLGVSGLDQQGRFDNPFWSVNMNPFNDNTDRFIGNFQLNYALFEYGNPSDFSLTSDAMYRLGADLYSTQYKQVFAMGSNSPLPIMGEIYQQDLTSNNYNSDLIVNFNSTLSEKYKFKLSLGYNLFEATGTNLYNEGDNFVIPSYAQLNNTTSQIIRQNSSELRRLAFYGDLTFDYNDWLFLDGVLRNEKSTTLPVANNSYTFGSGSLSFVFTDADIFGLKDIFKNSFLSMGKLRLNYAVVGKDAPLFGTVTTYTQASYADGGNGISFPYNGTVGFTEGNMIGNSGLKPEMTYSWEVGAALNFFENLFSIDFTYYNSVGKDLIFAVPIAKSSGYDTELMNAAQISNKGIELTLNINPIRSKEWRWNFGLNFAKNTNNVDQLAPGIDNLLIGGFPGVSVRAVPGMPYGTIWGAGWVRDANGNVIVDGRKLVNGQNNANYGYPILDTKQKAFGSYLPDWTMGIRNTISWNDFTLSFLFDIKQGGKMWNSTLGTLTTFGMAKQTEDRGTTKVFSGVKGYVDANGNVKYVDNNGADASSPTTNDIPAMLNQYWYAGSGGGNSSQVENFVQSTSWVRLRELSLSYALPRSLVNSFYLSDLIITLTGRNLWLSTPYTGVDPETSLMGAYNGQGIDFFNSPGIKSYIASITLKF